MVSKLKQLFLAYVSHLLMKMEEWDQLSEQEQKHREASYKERKPVSSIWDYYWPNF